MIPAGTFNQQYHRSLKTNVNEYLIKSLFEKTQSGTVFTPTAVSGLAGTILAPANKPSGEAIIKNGWDGKRFRFVLILDVFVGNISYVQIATGYTDYQGATANNIDPNLELYFNSFQTFVKKVKITPKGVTTVLLPHDVTQLVKTQPKSPQGSFLYDHMNPFLEQRLLRPQDVFNHLTFNMINKGLEFPGNAINVASSPYSEMCDTRTQPSGVLTASNRKNNNSTSYISSLLTGFSAAKKAHKDTTSYNLYTEASVSKEIADKHLASNRTIYKIGTTFQDFTKRGYLTYKEIQMVIPELSFVTKILTFDQVKKVRMPHLAGGSESLGIVSKESHASVILANSLPDLMIDSLLGQVAFMATNNYVDGLIKFTWVDDDAAKALTEGIEPFINKFVYRLTNEVLFELSNQGATRFELHVFADITDDIRITIGFDGNRPEPYVIPAFCDSIFSPIIGENAADLDTLATSMESLAENVCSDDL